MPPQTPCRPAEDDTVVADPGAVTTAPILPLHRECLAHFTGKWPAGYRPRWHRTPWWHLATTLLTLLVGVTASTIISTAPIMWWPLLGVTWMLTVHSGRKTQLVICHYAVHGTMTGHRLGDRILTEILSTLWIIQHFEGYFKDHVLTHHSRRLGTLEDLDWQFLLALGLRPGMSRRALWRRLYWTLISPRFHLRFLCMRLRVNFLTAPWYRRLLSWLYGVVLLGALLLTQAWGSFVVAWVLPVFPLYHISALLQFVCEHRWLYPHEREEKYVG